MDENFSKSVSVMIFRLYDFAKMMTVSADKYIRFHFNKSRVSFHSKNTRNSVVSAIKFFTTVLKVASFQKVRFIF